MINLEKLTEQKFKSWTLKSGDDLVDSYFSKLVTKTTKYGDICQFRNMVSLSEAKIITLNSEIEKLEAQVTLIRTIFNMGGKDEPQYYDGDQVIKELRAIYKKWSKQLAELYKIRGDHE